LGLVGSNGIGKSTALKILSGKLKPNLGRYDNPPDWQDVIKYFRGSELQSTYRSPSIVCYLSYTNPDYFTKILEDDLKAIVKPQYVDRIPKAIRSADTTVRTLIEGGASMDNMEEVLDVLGKSINFINL
jgi:ATP-binding cassette subfamily E protein 1